MLAEPFLKHLIQIGAVEAYPEINNCSASGTIGRQLAPEVASRCYKILRFYKRDIGDDLLCLGKNQCTSYEI